MPDFEATVRSELLFREVNERIFDIATNDGDDLEVLCECGDESCISTLVITARDYKRVRLEISHFVVCDGHELADVERVLDRTRGYLVVEKFGRAREAVERGPRQSAPSLSRPG